MVGIPVAYAGFLLRKARIRIDAWKNYAIALEAQYDCLLEAVDEANDAPRQRIASLKMQMANCSGEILRLKYELVYLKEY